MSTQTIPVEISLNEPLVRNSILIIGANGPTLRVATIEDIVGEKLRAILQQPIRNRSRRQDVLDIALVLERGLDLDRAIVAEALLKKSAARDVPVSRQAFRESAIRDRAQIGYDALADTTRVRFIPFDEAFAALLTLVQELALPEDAPASDLV